MKKSSGFSLIEVMLTLVIMFVLFVALLGVIQFSLSRQRYEGTLNSLKDFLQRQYSEVQNVVIDGEEEKLRSCSISQDRMTTMGRTNCYVVGRLLNIKRENNDGRTHIEVYQIIYNGDQVDDQEMKFLVSNDFALTDAYNQDKIKAFDGYLVDDYVVEWGAKLERPIPSASPEINDNLSFLIFRSPENGSIRTYVVDGVGARTSNITSMLLRDNLNKSIDMCVIPEGKPGTEYRAIRIHAGASNASGVEITLPNDLPNGGKCGA